MSNNDERAAFEASTRYASKLCFKRGGSMFAEDVPEGDYVDASMQSMWVFWQEAWQAARAAPVAAAGEVPAAGPIILNGMPVEQIKLDWVCMTLTENTIFNGADLLQAFDKLVTFYVQNRAAAPAIPAPLKPVAGDALDAALYLWLRNKSRSVDWSRSFAMRGAPLAYQAFCRADRSEMDADIDAAIEAERAEGGGMSVIQLSNTSGRAVWVATARITHYSENYSGNGNYTCVYLDTGACLEVRDSASEISAALQVAAAKQEQP